MVSFVSKVSKIGLDDIIPILVAFRIGALTTNTVFAQTVGSPDLIRQCFANMSDAERSFADTLLVGTNMVFSDRYNAQCGGNTLYVNRREEAITSVAVTRHFIEMADEHPYSAIVNELADNLAKVEHHTAPFNARCGVISNTILNIIEKHYDKDTIREKMGAFITIPYEFPRYRSATLI